LTGPEIWGQMDHAVDAIVCGVGSGGTLTGLTHFFRRASPRTEFVPADPQGSILAEDIRTGKIGVAGSWLAKGIGEDFVPPIADLSGVTTAYEIPDAESLGGVESLIEHPALMTHVTIPPQRRAEAGITDSLRGFRSELKTLRTSSPISRRRWRGSRASQSRRATYPRSVNEKPQGRRRANL
jgi:hypothetical protein